MNKALFRFAYNGAVLAATALFIPKYLYQRLRYGKYHDFWSNKAGIGFPKRKDANAQLIWIHAVSLGETKAAAPVAKLLKERYPDAELLITSVTETGHNEAKRLLPFADHHAYLPLDLSWIIGPIVQSIKPNLVLLSETDFWFNFLSEAKVQGAKVALINGKISERSCKRFKALNFLTKHFFAPVDQFNVQSKRYGERFQSLNVSSDKISVKGNLKLDNTPQVLTEGEKAEWRERLHLSPDDLVLVAGSTHEGEEELMLETFRELQPHYPKLKLILVPRHPERFQGVKKLLANSALPYAALSEIDKSNGQEKVILIDSMGLLMTCYQLATVAIVCGSFTSKVGGHNILEPSFYGIPVVFGPFMHTQQDFVELMLEHSAGKQSDAKSLTNTLRLLFDSLAERRRMGQAGLHLIQMTQGASKRTLDCLTSLTNPG